MTAAGIPVEVASDDTPLVREPAVLPLLEALRVVLDLAPSPDGPGAGLDAETASSLLVSPLAGLDATGLRTLARELRRREAGAVSPRPSADLVRDALLTPTCWRGCPPRRSPRCVRWPSCWPVRRLSACNSLDIILAADQFGVDMGRERQLQVVAVKRGLDRVRVAAEIEPVHA